MSTDVIKLNRIVWIDNCKGFAIILVVIGHILGGYLGSGLFSEYISIMKYTYEFIYSFHMPLFFLLSGYVFNIAYKKIIAQKKLRFKIQIANCIYIYVFWSGVQWLTKMLVAADVNVKFTLADLLLMPIKPMDPYWYIYVLVFYYVIFFFLEKINIDDRYKLIIAFTVSMSGSFVSTSFNFIFPLRRFLIYIFFFSLGIYISKFPKTKLMSGAAFAVYLLGSVISAIFVLNSMVRTLNVGAFGILSAMCLSMFILYLFKTISFLQTQRFLILCGVYSLEIYVTHNFITAANRILLLKIGLTNFYLNIIVNFIMAVFIPILCAFVLKKTGFHKIVFKPFSYISDRKMHC